jgi:menaquinone-dependent protoporphyrinogen oxidase
MSSEGFTMARILVLYGTTDGHTAKVARFLTDALGALGASVDLVRAGTASPDPRDYTGVIVAASLHARGFQREVIRWVRDNAKLLPSTTSAFLPVCLSVLQKDLEVQHDLGGIVNRFEEVTGWKPDRIRYVAGALLYTRYGWLKRMVMRRIAGRAGGSTDVTRDHEYTDWEDLRKFAVAFCAMCRAIACHHAASSKGLANAS